MFIFLESGGGLVVMSRDGTTLETASMSRVGDILQMAGAQNRSRDPVNRQASRNVCLSEQPDQAPRRLVGPVADPSPKNQ